MSVAACGLRSRATRLVIATALAALSYLIWSLIHSLRSAISADHFSDVALLAFMAGLALCGAFLDASRQWRHLVLFVAFLLGMLVILGGTDYVRGLIRDIASHSDARMFLALGIALLWGMAMTYLLFGWSAVRSHMCERTDNTQS